MVPPPPVPAPARLDDLLREALLSKLMAGNSGAPTICTCASACSICATATAMSRFAAWANSISEMSSTEWKPRHQSGVGTASVDGAAGQRYLPGVSRARSGF